MNGSSDTVLVTGGCGFIGTWVLRELLDRRLRVVVLDAADRPERWRRILGPDAERIPLVRGSLTDRGLLGRVFREHAVTHVIHLAALLTPACQADPWTGCEVNVMGSLALWEEARRTAGGVKGFSYASSVAVFGDEPGGAAGDGGAAGPVTFYGAFKRAVESLAGQYWRHFGIASLGIRPQVAYGPERDEGLTAGPSLAIRAAVRREPYQIAYTGRVGYDYVEDVARAFVRGALETPAGAAVVDMPGEVVGMEHILAAIHGVVPSSVGLVTAGGPVIPAHRPPQPHFITSVFPDWETTSLLEGVLRTAKFHRRQGG